MQYSAVSRPADRRPRNVISTLAIVLGAIIATLGINAGPSLAFTGPDKIASTAASNEASYWGAGCTKLDEPGGHSWEADADYSKVVLKAGQVDFVFYDVVKGDELEVDQNAISHFIFCPPVTTTTTTTTTTVPEEVTTTTTVPEEVTTTTVPEEAATTTTVPEEPIPTVVGQAGPTTTAASGAGGTITVSTELPQTGTDRNATMLVLGGLLVMFGAVLLLTVRRPVTI